MQFLTEAVVLSAFGGLVELLLAAIACYGLSAMLSLPFLFSPGINLLAFGFSAAIGVIFGYVPARRAVGSDRGAQTRVSNQSIGIAMHHNQSRGGQASACTCIE